MVWHGVATSAAFGSARLGARRPEIDVLGQSVSTAHRDTQGFRWRLGFYNTVVGRRIPGQGPGENSLDYSSMRQVITNWSSKIISESIRFHSSSNSKPMKASMPGSPVMPMPSTFCV